MYRPKKAVSRNSHRIFIGDSRLMPEIENDSVQLIIASPPEWKPKPFERPSNIGQSKKVETYIKSLYLVWKECFRVLSPGCIMCIHVSPTIESALSIRKFQESPAMIFERDCLSLGLERRPYIFRVTENAKSFDMSARMPRECMVQPSTDTILVFAKPGSAAAPAEHEKEKSKLSDRECKRYFNSNWTFPDNMENNKAWNPFTEEIPKRLIKMFTYIGETVLDPFAGEGTTCSTARDCGRSSIGYEINPKMEQMIRDRITGGQKMKSFSCENIGRRKKTAIDRLLAGQESEADHAEINEPAAVPEQITEHVPDVEKPAAGKTIKISSVYGMDTIVAEDGSEIRLIGLENPSAFYSRNRGIYRQALNFIERETSDRTAFLSRKGISKKSKVPDNAYYIEFESGTTLNEALIKNGYALSDRELKHELKDRYNSLEDKARANSMGLWALSKTDRPRK